jgi:hypothetical protein
LKNYFFFLSPNSFSPPGSSSTLRIDYLKDKQTNVQVFNSTTVIFLKNIDQINGKSSISFLFIDLIENYVMKNENTEDEDKTNICRRVKYLIDIK